MWVYEKKLQFPVNIKKTDPALAKLIMTQLGGPDGELAASTRYIHQRYSMPYRNIKALLTDIGTEEMAHAEMISAIVHQLIKNANADQMKQAGFADYYVDRTTGIYPVSASGNSFDVAAIGSKGDAITDLFENLAAEQKARTTYENLLRVINDPEVRKPIEFLRQREIVHFQRFGEALDYVRKNLDSRNYYKCNASFDKNCGGRDDCNQNRDLSCNCNDSCHNHSCEH